MDQTDFSMLAGAVVGIPLGIIGLHHLLPLPWSCVLVIPCGFVPVVALTFVTIEWLGRRSDRSAAPPQPNAEPDAAPDPARDIGSGS